MKKELVKKISVLAGIAIVVGAFFLIAEAAGEITVGQSDVVSSDTSVTITGHIAPGFLQYLNSSGDGIVAIVGPNQANLLTTGVQGTVLHPSGTTFAATVSSLLPLTSYYFNIYDTATNDPLLQNTQQLSTAGHGISAYVTIESSETTYNSATIAFSVDTQGNLLHLRLMYGQDASHLDNSDGIIWSGTTATGQPVSVPGHPINGLLSGTQYYYTILNDATGEEYATGHVTTLNQDGTTVAGHVFSPTYSDCTPDANMYDSNGNVTKSEYCLIEPLPILSPKIDVASKDSFGKYVNDIFTLAIGFGAVLAVLMIVIAGIQYMGTDSIFGKSENKSRIQGALFGLLLLLGSFIILKTINTDLLKIAPDPKSLAIQVQGATVSVWDNFAAADPNEKACHLIYDTAHQMIGTPTADAAGTSGGSVACSFVVDTIIEKAMGTYSGGETCTTPELKTTVLKTQLAASPKFKDITDVTLSLDAANPVFYPPAEFTGPLTLQAKINKVGQLAKEGDIIISPTIGTVSGHVGICDEGCAHIISNSSSEHKIKQNFTFSTWTNDANFKQLPLYIYRARDCEY